ncbi:MAG: hypothetical protein M3405_17145 [Acidobacteriota bacterium]|jgi:hypothetical protein|nr:hypothetical protein [Acidobacteriota bacterium]
MVKKTAKQKKQPKSRAKYKCPDEVKELLRKVNLILFPTNMIDLEFEIRRRTRILREKTDDNNASVAIRDVLTDCLNDLPDDFISYIKGFCYGSHIREIDINKADLKDIHLMAQAYMSFYTLHNETISYARRLKNERECKYQPNHWEVFPERASGVILQDENGNNYVDGLVSVIHKIIPDRFRMCEICNRIFWANRKDSVNCSKKCANTLRVRRSRSLTDEEKAERKAKRQANRKHNQKLKKMEKHKNVNI